MTLLPQMLPILIIIFAGCGCRYFRLFDENATALLTRLLFYIVMPITLFIDIALLPIHDLLYWPYLAAYLVSSCIMIMTSLLTSYYGLKRKKADLVINAMAASHTNTAYLAIPIFLLLFHTFTPVAGAIVVQLFFNLIIIFCLETFSNPDAKQSIKLRVFNSFWKAPILIGILCGLIVSLIHFPLPTFIQSTCLTTQKAAPFIALFALGLSLITTKSTFTRKDYGEIGLLVVLKNALHPIIAFFIGHFLFSLPIFWLRSLVLIAAMPTAKNLFVFAKQYRTGTQRASVIIVITTLISIISINLILLWL